ncbi:MAG: hypothetical protein DRJ97_03485 [Thermoprotei archaeon]|nr:MAG: hypothetical protein DRJ97_03485 [Thermoprotei archaeon]
MYLTREEEALLEGEGGEPLRIAMEILVALGEIYGAERLVEVRSTHISGTSYTSCGDAGIDFLRRLVSGGARLRQTSTLNPVAIPLNKWRELGFPQQLVDKQLEIISLYRSMGASGGFTCHPYFVGNLPRYGDHISWAESSAIVFANSVLGARTNREGGVGALAAALVGRTPLYGYHLDENREPTVKVVVEAPMLNDLDFYLLGYALGEMVGDGVPFIEGLPRWTGVDELKSLGASAATSGSMALFHAEGLTPEASSLRAEGLERLEVSSDDLKAALDKLSVRGEEVDCVAIGCPHCSLDELRRLSLLLDGRRVREDVNLWVFTSEAVRRLGEEAGYVQVIEAAGGHVLTGGCVVHTPLRELGVEVLATNSTKAAHYCSSLHGVDVVLLSLKECVKLALEG